MQQLQRGRHVDHDVGRRDRRRRPRTPSGRTRAAAACPPAVDEVAERRNGRHEVGVDLRPAGDLGVEQGDDARSGPRPRSSASAAGRGASTLGAEGLPSAAMLGASVASARMAEFLSVAWIAELDAAARAPRPRGRRTGPLRARSRAAVRRGPGWRRELPVPRVGRSEVRVVAGRRRRRRRGARSPTSPPPAALHRASVRAQDALAAGRLKVRGRPEVLGACAARLAQLDASSPPCAPPPRSPGWRPVAALDRRRSPGPRPRRPRSLSGPRADR